MPLIGGDPEQGRTDRRLDDGQAHDDDGVSDYPHVSSSREQILAETMVSYAEGQGGADNEQCLLINNSVVSKRPERCLQQERDKEY